MTPHIIIINILSYFRFGPGPAPVPCAGPPPGALVGPPPPSGPPANTTGRYKINCMYHRCLPTVPLLNNVNMLECAAGGAPV